MNEQDKNELILADVSEVLRIYARRRINAAAAVGQILLAVARPYVEHSEDNNHEL